MIVTFLSASSIAVTAFSSYATKVNIAFSAQGAGPTFGAAFPFSVTILVFAFVFAVLFVLFLVFLVLFILVFVFTLAFSLEGEDASEAAFLLLFRCLFGEGRERGCIFLFCDTAIFAALHTLTAC